MFLLAAQEKPSYLIDPSMNLIDESMGHFCSGFLLFQIPGLDSALENAVEKLRYDLTVLPASAASSAKTTSRGTASSKASTAPTTTASSWCGEHGGAKV
jgi:hypothetical protein